MKLKDFKKEPIDSHLSRYLKNLKLNEAKLSDLQKLQRNNFYEFFKAAWEILNPGAKLQENWHLKYLAEVLELVAAGEIDKLLINIAPRSAKSFMVSVAYPCWQWLQNPKLSYLCLSYASTLANDFNDLRRTLIKSDWYSELSLGEISLASAATGQVKNRLSEFANNFRGQMLSRGMDGSVTGSGADGAIIFDDPNNPDESSVNFHRIEKKFRDYSVNRRNRKKCPIIVIQQRCGKGDVSDVIIEKLNDLGDWTIIILPTKAKERTEIRLPGRSEIFKVREAGEFLHPERHGEKEDAEARKTLGSAMYSARHDQSPIALEGGIFPRQWYRVAHEKVALMLAPPPVRDEYREYEDVDYVTGDIVITRQLIEQPKWQKQGFLVMSVDATFGSISTTSSYVSIGVWVVAKPNFILVDVIRERMGFGATKQAIRRLRMKWDYLGGIGITLIENKANGAAIIEDLKQEFPGIIPINPSESKRARAEVVAPFFESGNISVINEPHAPWFVDYQMEIESFPSGADDSVDMSSQLITYYVEKWRKRPPTQCLVGKPNEVDRQCFEFIRSMNPNGNSRKSDSELIYGHR